MIDEKFNKLAKLAYKGASMQSICDIFTLEESNVRELMDSDAYKQALATITDDNFSFNSLIDRGWDGIEEAAMGSVLEELKHNPDPDFALRAAAMANKATRTHGKNKTNVPIQVQNNMQAIIHVQPRFADKLQSDYIVNDVKDVRLDKKVTNALNPNAVKHLLGMSSNSNDLLHAMPNIADAILELEV